MYPAGPEKCAGKLIAEGSERLCRIIWYDGRKGGSMSGIQRINIKPGLRVSIVLKEDQRSGKITEGTVKDILTRSAVHPHGIKVRLESGLIGRVKEIK
jgi:uncharacterized repeat protein (TIGR03833 family)